MKQLQESINKVLGEWNPIKVPETIATIEYRSYVDEVIQVAITKEQTVRLLEDIVRNRMGLSYDKLNPIHRNKIVEVAEKIRSCIEKSSAY